MKRSTVKLSTNEILLVGVKRGISTSVGVLRLERRHNHLPLLLFECSLSFRD